MKHPLSDLLGGDSTIVIHRSVLHRLDELGAVQPLEIASLLEHLIFLHRQQNAEWVTCPYSDIQAALLIKERSARSYLTFLRKEGLLESRRSLTEHNGQVSPYLQYQVQMPRLAELLGLGVAAKFAGSVLTKFAGSTSISKKDRGAAKSAARNEHFDAIVAALYPQGDKLSNASHVAKVANSLKAAGWTPEDITHVLSAVQRDKFWKTAITLGTFQKNAEDWRRRYGVARKEEVRPPVVTPETTPDDLDWTALE